MDQRLPEEKGHSRAPLAAALGITANADGDCFSLQQYGACLSAEGHTIDRGAIIALIDHAIGSHLGRRLGRSVALATLNLRIDWTSRIAADAPVQAYPKIVAVEQTTALVRTTIRQGDGSGPVALATSQLILGVAPGGSDKTSPVPNEPPLYSNSFKNFRELLPIDTSSAEIVIPPLEHLVGTTSVSALHGGIIAAALSTAAHRAIERWAGTVDHSNPLGLWVEFVRPAILNSSGVTISASIKRQGRSLASVEMIAKSGPHNEIVAFSGAKFLASSPNTVDHALAASA